MPTVTLSINNFTPLEKFLKKHRASTGGVYTHTSISSPPAAYFINNDDLEEFTEHYYDHIFVKKKTCHLTEGQKDCIITPIKIDLDFKSYRENIEKLYTLEDIIRICQLYMKVMGEWLVKPDPIERYCFILEKDKPSFVLDKSKQKIKNNNDEYLIKDGVHIMFPYICTKPVLQLKFRDYVYKNCGNILNKNKYCDKTGKLNNYADIFDRAVIHQNNWQMYGSSKSKEAGIYKVSNILEIYENKYNIIDLNKYSDRDLIELLSVRNRVNESMIIYEKMEEINKIQSTYDLKLNARKYRRKFDKQKTTKSPIELVRTIAGATCCNQYHPTGYNLGEHIPGYIDCLSVDRAKDYNSWIEVGWALHNIDNNKKWRADGKSPSATFWYNKSCPGGDRPILLQAWIYWSKKKGSGYEDEPDDTFIEEWDSMKSYGLGIGSLKMWAKEDAEKLHLNEVDEYDNLESVKERKLHESEGKSYSRGGNGNKNKYYKVRNADLHCSIMKATGKRGGTSYDVAKVMWQMYQHDFVCISIKDTLWYYYNDKIHKWVEDDKGIHLKMKISTEVWKKFKDKSKLFGNKVIEADDENEMKQKRLQSTADRLKATSFKSNVMTECAELFYDKSRKFFEKLDSNMNILGFNNGVYDLLTGDFRTGRPEDYISMSTNIDYIPYDENSVEVRDIYKMISEILTVTAVREYVLRLMATFLSGSTKSEKFHVWSGSGGNGKSKIIELLETAIGDYGGKMNISNLTQKRGNAGSANPELARTKGKRFINMQEPDEQCKLNVGLMKEMTGGDKIIARALYKEPFEFKPQFKMVLTCNNKPELPPDDDGTWRRVVLVEYNSKFKHEPNGDYDNKGKWIPENSKYPEFPIDETLNERFEDWAEPFMSILLHIYNKNKNKDLREPNEVKEYTEKYREQNNHFKEFINDKVIVDPNSEHILRIAELFDAYKDWFRENNGNKQHKKQKDLTAFMDKEFGQRWRAANPVAYTKRGYKGLILIKDVQFMNELDNKNDDD